MFVRIHDTLRPPQHVHVLYMVWNMFAPTVRNDTLNHHSTYTRIHYMIWYEMCDVWYLSYHIIHHQPPQHMIYVYINMVLNMFVPTVHIYATTYMRIHMVWNMFVPSHDTLLNHHSSSIYTFTYGMKYVTYLDMIYPPQHVCVYIIRYEICLYLHMIHSTTTVAYIRL